MDAYPNLFSIQDVVRIPWILAAFMIMHLPGNAWALSASSSQFSAVTSKNLSSSKKMTLKNPQLIKTSPKKVNKKQAQTPKKTTVPMALAKEGQWTVYSAQQGKGKLCYAMARPTLRMPKTVSLNHAAHLFVSTRPSEGVRNEVNITLGMPLKEDDSKAQMTVGHHVFPLTLKESYGWIKNVNEEKNAVAAMEKNKEIIVKVQSRKGTTITDLYSLKGLSQALARVHKECP